MTNIHVNNSGSIVGNLGAGNVARDISARDLTVEFVRDIVQQTRRHRAEIIEAGVDASDLDARLLAIEDAIARRPDSGLLRALLADLRNTVSGAAGNLVASGIVATLAPYLGAAAAG